MAQFVVTPVDHDPFGPGGDGSGAMASARPDLSSSTAGGNGFPGDWLLGSLGKDLGRFAGGIGDSLDYLGRDLMGQGALEVDPMSGVARDTGLMDSANGLGGLVMEGGLAAPRPEGSLGVFGGVHAQNADTGALRMANILEMQGTSPQDIWGKTGWFRGADQSWRFEIPDQQAKFTPPASVADYTKKISVYNQIYTNTYQGILRDKYGVDLTGDASNVDPNILHNAIKDTNAMLGHLAPKRPSLTLGDVLDHPALYEAYPDIKTIPFQKAGGGVSGGRGQYQPPYEGSEVRRIPPIPEKLSLMDYTPNKEMDFNPLSVGLHEVQHAIQYREGFENGGSPRAPGMREAGQAIWNEAQQRIMDIKRYSDWQSNPDDVAEVARLNKMIGLSDDPMIAYKALAGEAEARSVQTRAADPLSPLNFPLNSLDIDPYWQLWQNRATGEISRINTLKGF